MPIQSYRELKPTPEAEAIYRRWLSNLNDEFTRHQTVDRRSEIVRDELTQLFLGRPSGGRKQATLTSELGTNVMSESFDPRNATLEPEYYGDIDAEKYAVRKPLIYFWQMFDRSPAGLNHWLGYRFRCMLGRHIFRHLGKGVKILHNVEFTYGYNLTIGDNCIVHKNVLLDDRGEIILHSGTTLFDYAHIYSHTLDHQSGLTKTVTEIGPNARVKYHATVLAGANVGEDAMLEEMSLAASPVPPGAVSGGIPAQVLHQKVLVG
jgi:acetyltransferase-like isoleucine patch superfamily enzyme